MNLEEVQMSTQLGYNIWRFSKPNSDLKEDVGSQLRISPKYNYTQTYNS